MEFYVAYSVQCDLPDAEIRDEAFDIYDIEKAFLLELYDCCQKLMALAKENDGMDDDRDDDDMDDDDIDEYELENFESYMAKLEEKLADPSVENGLYDEELSFNTTEISISLATSDSSVFLQHLYDVLLEQNDCDDVWDLEPEDRSDLFANSPLLKYCAMLIASHRKPDPKTLKKKLDDYVCECDPFYLSDFIW